MKNIPLQGLEGLACMGAARYAGDSSMWSFRKFFVLHVQLLDENVQSPSISSSLSFRENEKKKNQLNCQVPNVCTDSTMGPPTHR